MQSIFHSPVLLSTGNGRFPWRSLALPLLTNNPAHESVGALIATKGFTVTWHRHFSIGTHTIQATGFDVL